MPKKLMIGVYRVKPAYIRAFKLEWLVLRHCPLLEDCRAYNSTPCLKWKTNRVGCCWSFIYKYIVRPDRERG